MYRIKGLKKETLPHNLRQNRVTTLCCQITMLIADIEDDIMDPVMQCTTLPSHSGGSLLQPPITKNQNALIDSQAVNKSPTHYPCDSARTSSDTYVLTMKMEILLEPIKQALGRIIKMENASRFKNHESSRIKDKDFRTNSDIQDLPSKISSLSREIVSKLQDDHKMRHVVKTQDARWPRYDQDNKEKIKISQ
ncbi:hypothetical protein Tco_0216183 [Tanacetum coccineum]